MTTIHEHQLGISLAIGLVIMSAICITTEAQTSLGFVSIDCGNSVSYNDSDTGLLWESDDKYTLTGMNGEVSTEVIASDNSKALKNFRYFPEQRNKHCYYLNLTTYNVSILIRVMFLHGSSSVLTLPITFDVYVNGTEMGTIEYGIYDTADILNKPVVMEGIFPCPGSQATVCLIPQKGVPFISSLELRQLDPDGFMYHSNLWGTTVWMENLVRVNCGAAPNSSSVRYPDDKYDRLWYAPGDLAKSVQASTNTTDTPSVTASSKNNNVPPKVMQDAWLNNTANSSIFITFSGLDSSIDYIYAAAYTEEIQSSPVGDRVFDGMANSAYLDVSITPSTEAELSYSSSVGLRQGNVLNFSFVADISSLLGPIVNAVEAYAVHDVRNSSTLQADVDALADLQNSFNLYDWQGDPCDPVPWDWVDCVPPEYYDGVYYYVARVTKLLLSSKDIKGSIPPSISQLEELTEIHLDNNSLTGTIPESLASIENLTLLLLNDNNLSGAVPIDIETKLGSNFSYSGNSLLTGLSPAGSPSIPPSSSPLGAPKSATPGPPKSGSPGAPSGSPTSTKKKKSTNIGFVIGEIAGGLLGLGAVLSILLWCFCFRKKANQPVHPNKQEVSGVGAAKRPTVFSSRILDSSNSVKLPSEVGNVVGYVPYEVVRIATDNFKKKIGHGSYGSVYHGWLENTEVAVKLNNIQSDQGQNEFLNEVDILTRVHHRNLVSLIGYCNEGKELILIYEYQVNGTLREWLHDERKTRGILDWPKRLQIASDGAKRLEYLHKGYRPAIIHRDVKSSNILLDDTLTARVADFGLSKTTPYENSLGFSTNVKGTPGYLDPEYHNLGRLTHKSDVYSYGVVLAKLITGRPPFIFEDPMGSPSFLLLQWLRKCMERNEIQKLADPTLAGKFNEESMWRLADIAMSCVDVVAGKRPDFSQIVQGINEAIESQDPKLARNREINQSILVQSNGNLRGSTSPPTYPLEMDSSSTSTMHSPIVERSRYYSIRSKGSYQNLN